MVDRKSRRSLGFTNASAAVWRVGLPNTQAILGSDGDHPRVWAATSVGAFGERRSPSENRDACWFITRDFSGRGEHRSQFRPQHTENDTCVPGRTYRSSFGWDRVRHNAWGVSASDSTGGRSLGGQSWARLVELPCFSAARGFRDRRPGNSWWAATDSDASERHHDLARAGSPG
jgi:hypothetical protein